MLNVLIITKKQIYIALALLLAIIVAVFAFMYFFNSNETFSETMKYAYNKISAEQANVLISENSDVTILDIRGEGEYLEGHLPNAILMPYKVLKEKHTSFDKVNKYLVYCEDGKKSETIARELSKNGFPNIYVLIGGISDWDFGLAKE